MSGLEQARTRNLLIDERKAPDQLFHRFNGRKPEAKFGENDRVDN